jgi:hypothetical protein
MSKRCLLPDISRTETLFYNGVTYTHVGESFIEHYRSTRNPNAPSYQDKPFAKHYRAQHKDWVNPKLELKLLKRAATTTDRKINETRVILKNKPDLNNRDEQVDLRNYLVWMSLVCRWSVQFYLVWSRTVHRLSLTIYHFVVELIAPMATVKIMTFLLLVFLRFNRLYVS